jgi:hypothetical protein
MLAQVEQIGLVGPGLASWREACAVLRGEVDFAPVAVAKPVVEALPPRDRRRTTFTIALALAAAEEALRSLDSPGPLATVFACSGGDTEIIDRICRALLEPGKPVSPADFHNSVHNAPAGYWSILTRDMAPTVSLSAFDASFAAGLIEAATQLASGAGRVLLVAYDTPAPAPIWRFRPLQAPFAVAMLLRQATVPAGSGVELALALVSGAPETPLDDVGLESLRLGNPAARSLPLLAGLARRAPREVILPYLPGRQLQVHLRAL